MASGQDMPAHDLRGAAVDYQRAKEKRSKWAHGQAWGPGRIAEDPVHARPLRLNTSEGPGQRRDGVAVASFKHQARRNRKADITLDTYTSGDSSTDDDAVEAVVPEPDADITYSFDAARGPGHGSQVLGMALADAIDRYEVKVTDKLIQDEYEVLGADGESVAVASKRNHNKAAATATEDDYEFVLNAVRHFLMHAYIISIHWVTEFVF